MYARKQQKRMHMCRMADSIIAPCANHLLVSLYRNREEMQTCFRRTKAYNAQADKQWMLPGKLRREL